ncbi:antigen 43 domain protein [Escherichia coli p0305293.6]|nr:antigen 43 domain protein [Escherichia coli p0305293.6]
MSLTTGVYGAAGHSSVDVKDDDGSRAGRSGMMLAVWADT